jgi:hypothetical protein
MERRQKSTKKSVRLMAFVAEFGNDHLPNTNLSCHPLGRVARRSRLINEPWAVCI